MRRPSAAAVLATLALTALVMPGSARQAAARGERPGAFDFYVLSLSWSPSYCEAEGGSDRAQCGSGHRYGFIVHGLWPQSIRGYPEYCPTRGASPSNADVRSVLDLIPSAGLVRHQWVKHGACTGLEPAAYFALVKKAWERISVPERYRDARRYMRIDPDAVERDFLAANPGLKGNAIAVTCDGRRLREVRICFTKDLRFQACPEVDRRACNTSSIVMPPVPR